MNKNTKTVLIIMSIISLLMIIFLSPINFPIEAMLVLFGGGIIGIFFLIAFSGDIQDETEDNTGGKNQNNTVSKLMMFFLSAIIILTLIIRIFFYTVGILNY